MSILYIRLPSKAAADSAPHWIALPCPFALVPHGDTIEREGAAPLSDLSGIIGKAQRVVLLLAASDVTLLRVQTPPLSPSRLKAALPNLVEDQLMSDPAECAFAAGGAVDGLRTVAVINRGWIGILITTLRTLGARHLAAIPSQLCLSWQTGAVSAAVAATDAEIDLTVRLAEQQGIGLPILPDQPASPAHEVVQALCAVVPEAPIILYVPQAAVHDYQEAAQAIDLAQRITVYADNWSRWIGGANEVSVDLAADAGGASAARMDWRAWRWPLILGAAVLLVNIAGLNIDWQRMKREGDMLRSSMVQTYRAAYPKETVIVDPPAQMRQKIAAARHVAGQAAPDDFTALAAGFGEALESVAASGRKSPGIASLEYRDRSLFVRLKADATMPVEQVKAALTAHGLSLTQATTGAWQIRSNK